MGPVFRGEDGETREPVVIKVIRVGLPPERVAVVASALAGLRERLPGHPALTPLLDTGVVDVEPFIVTPFIDGDSLDVALREFGPANMADALPRLRMLADAMDAAAAVGVAHGSLHLRDIVVSVDETVLTGMGVAAVLERVGVRPPVRRPYCAPEVALGHGISPAADQYALAAIAHEWLSGRRLAGSGAAGFQVPAVSEAGTEALHAVFARAMSEAPENRYPTVTAFVEAMAALAGQAAPRSKTNRRPAAVEAPRLAFDEPVAEIETVDDDVVPDDDVVGADDAPPAGVVEPADPLDAPLIVTPSPAAMAWEPEVAVPVVPRPFATLDDEAPDATDDIVEDVTPVAEPSWDTASADADVTPGTAAQAQGQAASSASPWATWVAVLLVATVAALAGGWALLRWGTPSSPAVATTTTKAADAPAPAPAATAPAPTPAAESAASAPPAPAATPAAAPPAPPPAAPRTTAPAASAETPAAPRRAATAPAAKTVAPRQAARSAPPTPAQAPRRAAPVRPAARPAAAAAAAGRLLVRSTPGGAEVFVNGERRGVTPLALRDLPFGAYAVRVVRAGFAPVEQRVAIDAGRPARSLELTLTRGAATPASAAAEAVAPGSLLVESRPAGARVLVDGAEIGVTPVTVPSLAAGPHTVRIERAGYVSITTTARIEARTRARVAVTLTAERPR